MNAMDKEDSAAALLLVSWKHHLVIDPQTAHELQEEKRRSLQTPLPNQRNKEIKGQSFPPVAALHGLIGECSPPWEKQLTGSDLWTNQRRLLLKQSYVKQHLYPLLSATQIDKLKKGGIIVNVYDREGNIYEMEFKLWGEKAHVLTNSNWLRFCRDLVKEEDWITLWMFKHVRTHQVCFAIVSERRPISTLTIANSERSRKKSTCRKNDLSTLPLLPERAATTGKRSRENDLSTLPNVAEEKSNNRRSKSKENDDRVL